MPHIVTYQAVHETLPMWSQWRGLLLKFGGLQAFFWQNPGGTPPPPFDIYAGGTGDWFYDATRIFYQIGDYVAPLGANYNPTWGGTNWYQAAALAVTSPNGGGYRDYVEIDHGVQGHFKHSQGLRMHYQRTGDPLSKHALHDLATTAYSNADQGDTRNIARELAFGLLPHVDERIIGEPALPGGEALVNILLDIMDNSGGVGGTPGGSWFGAASPPGPDPFDGSRIVSFQVGIVMEALIYWWEHINPDPRILSCLQNSLPKLYAWCWVANQGGFVYDLNVNNTTFPGLNMFCAAAYAWAFAQTGTQQYATWGDEIWTQGICQTYNWDNFFNPELHVACTPANQNNVTLNVGKFYNEFYRWSVEYLYWRFLGTAPSSPLIGLSQTSLNFAGVTNDVDPPDQTLVITNVGTP